MNNGKFSTAAAGGFALRLPLMIVIPAKSGIQLLLSKYETRDRVYGEQPPILTRWLVPDKPAKACVTSVVSN